MSELYRQLISYYRSTTHIALVLLQFDVGGWGGYIPDNAIQDGVTNCQQGVDGMYCEAWTDTKLQAGSFFNIMACMSTMDLKLALVSKDPQDAHKLETMINHISDNWYPGLNLPPLLYQVDVHGNRTALGPPCYSTQICRQNQGQILGGWTWDSKPDETHCAKPDKSFKEMVMTLRTESELNSYLENYGKSPAQERGEGFVWGAVIFSSMGSGDGSPGSAGDWEYTIRLNSTGTLLPSTEGAATSILRPVVPDVSRDAQNYEDSGFIALQLLVDRYILHLPSNRNEVQDDELLAKNHRGDNSFTDWIGSDPPGLNCGDQQQCQKQCQQQCQRQRDKREAWEKWLNEDGNREALATNITIPLKFAPETVAAVALPVADQMIDAFYSIVSTALPFMSHSGSIRL